MEHASVLSPFQRKFILALIAVNLAMLAGINGDGWQIIGLSRRYFDWDGAFLAEIQLIAVWAALSERPLVNRLPEALGMASLAALAAAWSGAAMPLLLLLEAILQVLLLISLQFALVRRRGWRIRPLGEKAVASQGRFQFSLQHLFLWTTCAAVILALAKWIAADRMMPRALSDVGRMWFLFDLFVPALLSLPAFLSGLRLVLGGGGWWKAAVMAIGAFAAGAAPFLLSVTLEALYDPRLRSNLIPLIPAIAGSMSEKAIPYAIGFLCPVLGTLLVLRWCGYRLLQGGATETETGQLPPEVSDAGRRIRFIVLVGILTISAGSLVMLACLLERIHYLTGR